VLLLIYPPPLPQDVSFEVFLITDIFTSKLIKAVAMKGEEYLTKPGQFILVLSQGSSWVGNLVVMRALPNGLKLSRYGLVASKRVGNAVVRNRQKRLLREILRQTPLKPGWDIVFITRPAAANASFTDLRQLVRHLLTQAKLLVENYEKACLSAD
jgi:ribonuclease P protein component|tara:strand:+ start:266 stop:730 length:465 start_codon:yes stop_codon:yes gene_type:complete